MDIAQVVIDFAIDVVLINVAQGFALFVGALTCGKSKDAKLREYLITGISWSVLFVIVATVVGGAAALIDLIAAGNL